MSPNKLRISELWKQLLMTCIKTLHTLYIYIYNKQQKAAVFFYLLQSRADKQGRSPEELSMDVPCSFVICKPVTKAQSSYQPWLKMCATDTPVLNTVYCSLIILLLKKRENREKNVHVEPHAVIAAGSVLCIDAYSCNTGLTTVLPWVCASNINVYRQGNKV